MSLRQVERWRETVGWFGPTPSQSCVDCFRERDLALVASSITDLAKVDLRNLRAAVVAFDPNKPRRLQETLEKLVGPAQDHGIALIVIATPGDFRTVQGILAKGRWDGATELLLTAPESRIAQRAATHAPGPPAHYGLRVLGSQPEPDELVLFQRAFADCDTLQVARLSAAWSANVYSVFATLSEHNAGPRPLPFFAKVDKRIKIAVELEHYEAFVSGFVPFSHRPNLAPGRCLLGSRLGILVGTFVERSESLLDVAHRGEGSGAIYSLFDEALRGWRLQALEGLQYTPYASTSAPLASLADSIKAGNERKPLFGPKRIGKRLREVAAHLGVRRSPEQLLDIIEDLPSCAHLRGPIHGDLHGRNVRVHDGRAILIDFYAARIGPLALDPASLEVSIVFDAYGGDLPHVAMGASGRFCARDEWTEFVGRLYERQFVIRPPPPASSPAPREWLWNTVRQVRLLALASSLDPDEYPVALAIQLMRYAGHLSRDEGEEYRRAYAYVVADRLAP